MLGKCPLCKVKLDKKELAHLKAGDAARCLKCGRLYVSQPLWIFIKVLFLALPMIVGPFNITYLTLACCILTFLTVVFYHEVQAYLPLVEENSL